jgi:hypothetical protein
MPPAPRRSINVVICTARCLPAALESQPPRKRMIIAPRGKRMTQISPIKKPWIRMI